MLRSAPFLLFDGNCRAAMIFYHECLGGDLTLIKLGETPMKDQFPPEKHDRIINARLKSGAIDISATDWMASPKLEPQQGNTMSIYITGEKGDDLKQIFDKLAAGADQDERTFMKLHDVPFGIYGQFTDKYGVSWIFVGDRKE